MVTTRSRRTKGAEPGVPSSSADAQQQDAVRQPHNSQHQQRGTSQPPDEEHIERLQAYRKEWAPPDTLHGKAMHNVTELYLYVNYLVGQEILDHSERFVVIIILLLAGVLGLAGAYKQATALARLLHPLVLKGLDAVLKRLQ